MNRIPQKWALWRGGGKAGEAMNCLTEPRSRSEDPGQFGCLRY